MNNLTHSNNKTNKQKWTKPFSLLQQTLSFVSNHIPFFISSHPFSFPSLVPVLPYLSKWSLLLPLSILPHTCPRKNQAPTLARISVGSWVWHPLPTEPATSQRKNRARQRPVPCGCKWFPHCPWEGHSPPPRCIGSVCELYESASLQDHWTVNINNK